MKTFPIEYRIERAREALQVIAIKLQSGGQDSALIDEAREP